MANKKGLWLAGLRRVKMVTAVVCLFVGMAATVPLSTTTFAATGTVTDPSCTGSGEKITTDSSGNISCNCPSGETQIVALDGTQQCSAPPDCTTGQQASCGCPAAGSPDYTPTCSDSAAQVAKPNGGADPNSTCTSSGCDLVTKYVDPTINLLGILVGVVVVVSIITGGIQYSTSSGDPQKAAKAKGRIMNAVIALVAFAFLWGFLQFIIPGGVFKS